MPTVSDTYETVFKISGAERLINAFRETAKAANMSAEATEKAAKRTETLRSQIGDSISGYLTFTAVIATATRAINEYAAAETTAFRAGVILKNLGSTIDVDDLKTLGRELQNLTGVDDDLIVSMGALLARFRLTGAEIKSIIPTIVDAAAATGQTGDELAQTVGRALLGNTRGLRQLGIEFKATGDRARDLLEIQKQLEGRFGGAGAAFRESPGGVLQNLGTAIGNFFEVLGEKSGGVQLLEAFAQGLTTITELMERLQNPFDALFNAIGWEGKDRNARRQFVVPGTDPLSQVGQKGSELATESTLKEVAENTGKLGPLVREVLGGRGTVARRAFGHRDARMAFGI